jgi:serine/threonine protein kinase
MPSLPAIPGYDVEAELGRGGMGVVYRVRRQATGEVLALKMIRCVRRPTLQEYARFRVEAEALACLDHPNIVHIRDVGVWGGQPYFALEFAEGGNLRQAIGGRPQPVGYSAELVRTLALAMHHAHQRAMLHRDLKPANVLLMKDNTPKITDFGLVKFVDPIKRVSGEFNTFGVSILDYEMGRMGFELRAQYASGGDDLGADPDMLTRTVWAQCAARTGLLVDESRQHAVREFLSAAQHQSSQQTPDLNELTRAGAIVGTPLYMAPEQALGEVCLIGPHTDVYALGGILYQLLSGRPPIEASASGAALFNVVGQAPRPLHVMNRKVPPPLEQICMKCLEKDIRARYPRADALAQDLQRFLDEGEPDSTDGTAKPTTMAGCAPDISTAAGASLPPTGSWRGLLRWWPFGRRLA